MHDFLLGWVLYLKIISHILNNLSNTFSTPLHVVNITSKACTGTGVDYLYEL